MKNPSTDSPGGKQGPHSPDGEAALDPAQLDRHVEWLRRLSRSLISDSALADDLVQDTALAALATPPQDMQSPRRWLAQVLRHRATDAMRATRSRTHRESTAARDRLAAPPPESSRPADDLVSEVETGRLLSDLVLGLAEPTRSTLLMRFWEGLPPRTIARRQGVPVATVKSRIARGLLKLRKDLDERHGGDRKSWMIAVLPLARSASSGAAVLALGGFALNLKVTSVVAACLAGTLYLLLPSGAQPDASEPAETVARRQTERPSAASGESSMASSRRGGRERAALAAPSTRSKEAAAAAPKTFEIAGLVLSAEARPAAQVVVTTTESGELAETDGLGRFTLEAGDSRGTLEAAAETDWVTVRPAGFNASSSDEPVLIVAPSIDLSGWVVDEAGQPAAGVRMTLDLPQAFVTRFDTSHAKSIRLDWKTSTDADGHFQFEAVPSVAGATLEATRDDGVSARTGAPITSREDIYVVLKSAPIPTDTRLVGRVLRANGDAASLATVALGTELTRTDESGRFMLDLALTGSAEVLRAIEPGALIAAVERPGDDEGPRRGWPDQVEVRLTDSALSIAGVVVGVDGQPRSGARVWIDAPTEFGVMGLFPVRAEGLAGGHADPVEAIRSRGEVARATGPVDEGSATAAMAPTSMLPFCVTDDQGRFRLDGLMDRDYVLNVIGPDLDFGVQSDPISAGSQSAEIEVPAEGVYPEVRGRLETRRGDPLAGVNLTPWVAALDSTIAVRGGQSHVTRFFYGAGARSDKDGRFLLKNVPMRDVQLWIAGDGVTPTTRSVEDIVDPLDVTIELAARIEVSVQILDPSSGVDRVTVERFDGSPHGISRIFADGSSTSDSLTVEDGRTGVFAVTTDAEILTLLRGTEVVEVITLTGDTESVQDIIR